MEINPKNPQNNLYYDPNYVSKEESVSSDEKETEEIKKVLIEYNLFESREDSRKREEVLNKINSIVKKAIYILALKKGFSEDEAKEAGGKIFAFGSYRLGIAGTGDDIDVLCVGPNHVDRKQFFEEITKLLEKEKEISELFPIPDAYVPIIKIIFSGIHIDLLIARLSFKSIDNKLSSLLDDELLKNCSKECVLSLNGCRVTNMILSLVPHHENFRLTLRAIKLWAKRRGIYSNSFGYSGGVAWAILVAKICKMFPNLKPNKLIKKFFEVYSQWDWDNPVQLIEIKKDVGFSCPVEIWKKEDNKSCFNVLTPAFPCQNTNYNTTETTKRVMLNEFTLFKDFTDHIIYNTSTGKYQDENFTWKTLFNIMDFFNKFSCFLQIDILATNEDAFRYWDGFVESRLRFLIKQLEDVRQIKVRPYSTSFNLNDMSFAYSKTFYYGIEFVDPNTLAPNINKNDKDSILVINLRKQVRLFIAKINERRTDPNSMNLRLKIKTSDSLPLEILQEKQNEKNK